MALTGLLLGSIARGGTPGEVLPEPPPWDPPALVFDDGTVRGTFPISLRGLQSLTLPWIPGGHGNHFRLQIKSNSYSESPMHRAEISIGKDSAPLIKENVTGEPGYSFQVRFCIESNPGEPADVFDREVEKAWEDVRASLFLHSD